MNVKQYIILFLLSVSLSLKSMVTLTLDETIYEPKQICNNIIESKNNPQIILWYFGESGLTNTGAKFYKDNIFDEFSSHDKPYKFYLYDLAAWEALRKKKVPTTQKNKIAQFINKNRFQTIHSSDFFQDLQKEGNSEVINYYNNNILKNDDLYVNSLSRTPNNIKIKDIITSNSVEIIHEMDTAQTYSALQYLELLFLIKKVIQNSNKKEDIIFLLPNDEAKYYMTSKFVDDVNFIISHILDEEKLTEPINIDISCFSFGDNIQDRPYIQRDKKVTKLEIENYL